MIWPFLFIAALISGDAPGSEQHPLRVMKGVLLAGLVPFATRITARIVSCSGRYNTANWIALLPVVALGVLFGGLILWSLVMDALIKLH
jgi:hypothetical protein